MSAEKEAGGGDTRRIRVDYLSRVEGEGAFYVKINGAEVEQAELRIFEPPRFFEGFLRGRSFLEPPDITARICGICPVAYQMSAVHALEAIVGFRPDATLRALRRLLYCGEWIESHALHVFFLHAPDFLGFPDAMTMAKTYPELVGDGLAIKKAGNAIVARLGGREIHPINVRLGGFYRFPRREELRELLPNLRDALGRAEDASTRVAGFEFPHLERDVEFVGLRHHSDYPMNEGRIVSNRGLDIDVEDYDEHFVEEHLRHSHALQSRIRERGAYLCGPLARFNLSYDRLRPRARELADAARLERPCRNPFKSIVVRMVEVVHALDEAIAIIDSYQVPEAPSVALSARAGTGRACTEAPRGLLYHRYRIDAQGTIEDAKIVPPTSQNQRAMEEDLVELVSARLDLDDTALRAACEQAIRNYDPCISCATHFLRLHIERR